MVPSTSYDWLDFSLEVLVQTIRRNRLGGVEVCRPSHENIEASARLLRANLEYGELLIGSFAVVDGGRVSCALYSKP